MKNLIYILIALLAGLMLGSWSVKADLRKAHDEIRTLKNQLASKEKAPSKLSGITSMLKLPDVEPETPKARHRQPPPPAGKLIAAHEPSTTTDTNIPPPVSPVRANAATNSHSMKEQLEKAANLWKVRVDLAQNSFISNVTTNEEQAVQFAVSMAAMNLRLSNSIRTWVDQVKTDKKEPSPEQSIRLLNELSSTLVWAYEDLDRSQPEDWRNKAGAKFEVFDFINPEVALPLSEMEGVFGHSHHPNPRDSDEDTETILTIP